MRKSLVQHNEKNQSDTVDAKIVSAVHVLKIQDGPEWGFQVARGPADS